MSFREVPRLIRGGIVTVNAASGEPRRVLALQYNPDSVTRSFQPQAFSSQEGDRSEALRLKGPPVETLRFDAEIDAADQIDGDNQRQVVAQYGLHPFLAALELMLYPSSRQIASNRDLAERGALEIVPMEADLTLFIWSRTRVMPVRLTDMTVTEEAFDANLNPIRAKVSLSLRVLSIDDLGADHVGSRLFVGYLKEKERMRDLGRQGALDVLGIGGILR